MLNGVEQNNGMPTSRKVIGFNEKTKGDQGSLENLLSNNKYRRNRLLLVTSEGNESDSDLIHFKHQACI
jgi:hypothetical protein